MTAYGKRLLILWCLFMNKYEIKQTSSTTSGGVIIGALMMLELLSPGGSFEQPAVDKLVRSPIQTEASSKTFGRYTNVFTGEYEDVSLNFEENVSSFYAQLLAIQEPLEKEFKQVLHDNLWDLLVHT